MAQAVMTPGELATLYRLLRAWIAEPDWNTASPDFAAVVETQRQVLLELQEQDHGALASRLQEESP